MRTRTSRLATLTVVLLVASALLAGCASTQTGVYTPPYPPSLEAGASGQGGASRPDDPNNWPMYHRTYDAYRYSPLAQINRSNVKDLKVAWVHQSGVIAQGLESTPLVIDGVMYYIASNNR